MKDLWKIVKEYKLNNMLDVFIPKETKRILSIS